jgi:gliding motility-associated-like protein
VTAFDYDNSFCFGAADASPNLAADFTTGGTFTGTNGLVIDPATGIVNVTASPSGEHTVTYTFAGDPSNCINAGNASYTFTIGNEIAFGFDGDCQGTAFVITASPESGDFDDSVTFTWKTATGTIVGTDANTFNVSDYANSTPATDVFPMEFFLTVNINGCETTRSYTVDGISCTIQKGISPNNDGKNDSFDLTYMGVKKLSIFNRYGQDVYTKGNYTNEWHGQGSNGDELPTGTYYYVIDRTSGKTETGWIYINRQE